MKILISGSNGLLGQKLVKQLSERNIEFLATSKGDNRNPDCPITCYQSIDITDKNQVEDVVKSFMPDSIIHTAAHNQCGLLRVESRALSQSECFRHSKYI